MASPSAKCVVLFVNVHLKREDKQQRETTPRLRSDIFDITIHRNRGLYDTDELLLRAFFSLKGESAATDFGL